ncbi:MAG: DsrE family protein [candidate division KSB1 bacterium]|nr:DsrE family protein [candidate division KSB1 bacterium]MDZ7318577.1 DsrE family protein [candidate division KSB1 bacterium]MDZ7339713.1 DsrE family protein [candidate division KSB1 bacterium]
MKKFAYIITHELSAELLEDNLLAALEPGNQEIKLIALFFVDDGIYHLIKGNRILKKLKAACASGALAVFACNQSTKVRKIHNMIFEEAKMGSINDFYLAAADADHIIAF